MKTIITFFKKDPLRLFLFPFLAALILYFVVSPQSSSYHIIHCSLDDHFPLIPSFIFVYFYWYLYEAFTCAYAFFCNDAVIMWRETIIVYLGFILCILFFVFYPTAIDFRPSPVETSNFFEKVLYGMYNIDKPVNVFPSMHCYGAISSHVILSGSKLFHKHKFLHLLSFLSMVGICLSTLLVKQHSVLDIFGSAVLCLILTIIAFLFIPEKRIKNNEMRTL